jgi:DNA-binding response OmpR family regulator
MSRRGRVAVVEDDAEMGAVLADLLVARGYEVACYRDNDSAQRGMRLAPPDLILCDQAVAVPGAELSRVPTLLMGKATPPEVLVNSVERVFSAARQQADSRGSAEERSAALEAVSAGAAHEINDPLACIFVNLEELRETLPEDAAASVHELVEDALEAAHRIRRTVRDLQGFLRRDDGRPVPVEIEHVIDAALRLVRTHLGHRASISKGYSPSPMVVSSDGRLRQLFIHLLLHVAESIPQGHAEHTSVVVMTRTSARGECEIEVVRTGRYDGPFEKSFDISLCDAIASSVGGMLERARTPDGMSWRVVLPAALPGTLSQLHAPVAGMRSRGVPRRVLIVDDDELLARALARGLAPHEVTVALSIREAFELLLVDAGYDLVLCDALMPRAAGIELYSQLRALRPGAEKTIVFMTAAAEDSAALELLHALPNRVLHKPFEVREIRRLLERELS